MSPARTFAGPNLLIGIALVPMLLLVALVAWWFTYFRPSGYERWGDGALLIYAFILAYPLTLLFAAAGGFRAYRRSRRLGTCAPPITRMLGAVAILLLLAPWLWGIWVTISERIQ